LLTTNTYAGETFYCWTMRKADIWKLQCKQIESGKQFIKTTDELKQISITKQKKDGTYLQAQTQRFEKKVKVKKKKKKKPYWKKPKPIEKTPMEKSLERIENNNNWIDLLIEVDNLKTE
jgi:hypothetical protein